MITAEIIQNKLLEKIPEEVLTREPGSIRYAITRAVTEEFVRAYDFYQAGSDQRNRTSAIGPRVAGRVVINQPSTIKGITIIYVNNAVNTGDHEFRVYSQFYAGVYEVYISWNMNSLDNWYTPALVTQTGFHWIKSTNPTINLIWVFVDLNIVLAGIDISDESQTFDIYEKITVANKVSADYLQRWGIEHGGFKRTSWDDNIYREDIYNNIFIGSQTIYALKRRLQIVLGYEPRIREYYSEMNSDSQKGPNENYYSWPSVGLKRDDTATGYVGSFVGFTGYCIDIYGNRIMIDDQRICFVREDSQLMYQYLIYVNTADYENDQLMTKIRAICKNYSPVGVIFTVLAL